MSDKNYGLEFTYHNGDEKKRWYSQSERDAEFQRWARKLNKPGYKDPQVRSVRKVQK